LRGAKPADIPAEQPTKLELIINTAASKALGLTLPPDIAGLCRRVDRMNVRRRDSRKELEIAALQ
jgi:ABC-type uncharacterized transport system substrate-binding protein